VLNTFDSVEQIRVFARNSDAAAGTILLASELTAGTTECQWLPLEAAADFGGADLTCNTIPAEAASDLEVDVPFGESWVFDVAYAKWPSTFSTAWKPECRISGLEMLLWQALAQVRIFVNGNSNASLDDEGSVFKAMRRATT